MKKSAIIAIAMAASLPAAAQTASTDTVQAQYPGGTAKLTEYIEANRNYPAAAMRNGIEGIVDVRFLVKQDGSREQLSIVRLVDPDLEAEALRLVKGMPAWIPANVNGKPVDSQATVQIPFMLPE